MLDIDSDQKTLTEYMFSYPYVNWVFTLGTPYTVTDREVGSFLVKDTRILGPRTNFAEYLHPLGNVTFGITFQFGGTYPIFKEETKYLTNKVVLQEELFPNADWLTSSFHESKLEKFMEEVVGQISTFDPNHDRSGRSIWDSYIALIVKGKNYTTPARILSKNLRVSQRHLQRITWRYCGLTPKQVQSMIRCRLAIRHIQHTGSLLDFFRYGYYDQNHFIKDVKRWSGTTPRKLLSLIKDARPG